jgi:pimeloyl-ACP methyl ester carboxylesterase
LLSIPRMRTRPSPLSSSDEIPTSGDSALALLSGSERQPKRFVVPHLKLQTRHGEIALRQTAGQRLPILLLHGGGLCKEIFNRQLESSLGNQHHVIAIDLPGHGASRDAIDPGRTYSIVGLADLALEVLEKLDIDTAVVVGVSLGGLVALEMIQTFPGLIGVGVTGVPIASLQSRLQSDLAEFDLIGESGSSTEREERFLFRCFGDYDANAFREAVSRVDPKFLQLIAAEMRSGNHRWATSEDLVNIPVLAITGSNGPVANTGRASGGQRAQSRFSIMQSGPAPYLQVPEIYKHILGRFMSRMVKRERQKLASPHTWYGG